MRRMVSWLVGVVVLLGAVAAPSAAQAPDGSDFPGLTQDAAVYDATGDSLTADQLADLEARAATVGEVGADVVLYVRDLDASPEETLEQVETLHGDYADAAAVEPDTAVAVLVNRDPDDDTEARAGVFVGRTWDEGNIPEDEQEAIIEDVLIPPLRDGDVHASLAGALDRVASDIENGPPRSSFEIWSQESAGWVPWAAGAGAVLLLAFGAAVWSRRERGTAPEPAPTTRRPGDLTPALAAALALGGAQASALPATVVDLAARGGVVIEPEEAGEEPSVRVRLVDETVPRDPVEQTVWRELAERADDRGVVPAEELKAAMASSSKVSAAVTDQLRDRGHLAAERPRRAWLIGLSALLALAVCVLCLVVAASGGGWAPGVAAGLAGLVTLALFVLLLSLSGLSAAGQDAAAPWRAYRAGLQRAAKDDPAAVDLDDALPDVMAMNLAGRYQRVLEDPTGAGGSPRAFQDAQHTASGAVFPFWAAWTSTTASASSTGSSTVTTTTSSGGGAAGST